MTQAEAFKALMLQREEEKKAWKPIIEFKKIVGKDFEKFYETTDDRFHYYLHFPDGSWAGIISKPDHQIWTSKGTLE